MKLNKIIRIGSRGSALALAQIEEVKELLGEKGIWVDLEKKIYKTQGDRNKKTPLTNPKIADNFFTDTLDKAILKEEIDVAIHSAKDLPQDLKQGLSIFALTKTIDETDAFVGNVPFKNLKRGAKIGTSSLVRQRSILELKSNIKIVNIRGTIQERLKLLEDGKLDGIVVATAALKRLKLEHLIKDIMPWEATPLQGQLAVVGKDQDIQLKELFSAIDVRRFYGKVILVGAGPGDPELITFKGIKALQKCDCVIYDYLVSKDLLNYAPRAEKIYAGKRKGDHAMPQEELSRMLKEKAMAGKTVVRLKGGDPLIFGRGADEISYLKAYHIDVEVIPGVSSATAIPSLLGVPLTARGISSSVAFLSGHGEGEKKTIVKEFNIPKVDTVVFLMGLTKLNAIVRSLLKAKWNKETPIMIISKGTCSDEQIVTGTLKNIERDPAVKKLEPPALIVAGEIVRFGKKKNLGSKVLYLGTNPRKYLSLGPLAHFPMIEIRPAQISDNVSSKVLNDLKNYDMILLTSRFAVEHFFNFLQNHRISLQSLNSRKFVVIGEDTAETLRRSSLEPVLVAKEETSVGLLNLMKKSFELNGKKILFPRSSLPNPLLKIELSKTGALVDEFVVYDNIKPPKRPLPKEAIDRVIFTSPSTVRNFIADYGKIPKEWKILAKGETTRRFLEDQGYSSEVLNYG